MSGFFYGFTIPVLMVITVVLFRINYSLLESAKTLKEIKELLSAKNK